jgi:hypothetical protein
MTKAEILSCEDPSTIWDEMERSADFRNDRDIWLHLNQLTYKEEVERVTAAFGSYSFGAHLDYKKRNL